MASRMRIARPSLEALVRSAYCRMTQRPIKRIEEPYTKPESTADPRFAAPSS
jgi:hypothetical protein